MVADYASDNDATPTIAAGGVASFANMPIRMGNGDRLETTASGNTFSNQKHIVGDMWPIGSGMYPQPTHVWPTFPGIGPFGINPPHICCCQWCHCHGRYQYTVTTDTSGLTSSRDVPIKVAGLGITTPQPKPINPPFAHHHKRRRSAGR